jgi:serine phosphatase RsbU (regulator of sigma subunit)
VLPAWFGPVVRATSVDVLASQAEFDALGCMLSLVFGYMLYIAFISRQGTKQLRLDAEFALAREIHAALVPPIAARTAQLELWGRSDPSTEVGGDLVDVVEDGDATLAVVADVSGHGVSAGMLTAMTRSAIRTRMTSPWTIDALLAGIDRLMLGLGRPDRFVTAVCVRFDAAGAAEVGLAGHLPLLVVRAANGAVERIDNQRPPLGAPFEAAFPVTRTRYAPGDLFALFTDGLTEARDASEREWGIEAVEAVLREQARAPLAEIAQMIFDRSRAHGASDDDQSLLLIRAL